MADYSYIFSRSHRNYRKNRTIWERSHAAYCGGADYIQQALIRHVSEIDLEFAERLKRAYYFNYPRKIARLITQYILAVEPLRAGGNLDLVEDFSRSGLRTNEVMRQLSTLLNIYGTAAILVDMPFFEGEIDYERCKNENLRPFAKVLSPLNFVDYAYGADGKLDWILIEEHELVEKGPFLPNIPVCRRKLFTRNELFIFEKNSVNTTELIFHTAHNLNQVPAVIVTEADGYALDGGHYFEDVVRISDAILNNESEAQMNMVKQMFGLLVISDGFARGAKPMKSQSVDGDYGKFSHTIARSAAIWESPEERGISRYISPSGADTRCIRDENLALKKELFDIIGLAAQSESRLMQSADSKAWDHHNVRQFLCGRAELLEQSELAVWNLMHLYDGSIPVPQVIYNRDFSVIDLESSIRTLLELDKISESNEFHREVKRTALFFLEKLKKIAPEIREQISAEINQEAVNV